MALGQRIKEVREELKLSQQDLCARTNGKVGQTTLSSLEKRDSANSAGASALAEALGINLKWALTGEGTKWIDRSEVEPESHVKAIHPEDPLDDIWVNVPESTISFRGGKSGAIAIAFEEQLNDREPAGYRLSWFQKEQINPKKAKRFRVVGNSMEPMLFPGDSVLVNTEETQIREGLIYVFRHGDELKVKKLIPRGDGSLVLRSINREEYPDDVVPADQVGEHLIIIGRVRDKSGRGGLGPSGFSEPQQPHQANDEVLTQEAVFLVSHALMEAGKTVTRVMLKELAAWAFGKLKRGEKASSVEKAVLGELDRLRAAHAEIPGRANHD